MFETTAFRDVWAPRLLSVVRIFLGLLYLQHGLSKHFGWPAAQPPNFQAWSMLGLAGGIEIVGGILLALGFSTRWVALILSGEMAVAYFIYANRLARGFYPLANGGQTEVIYSFFFLMFFLVGGGAWSIDRLMKQP